MRFKERIAASPLDPRSAVAYSSASQGLREPMQRLGEGAGKSPLEQLKEEDRVYDEARAMLSVRDEQLSAREEQLQLQQSY